MTTGNPNMTALSIMVLHQSFALAHLICIWVVQKWCNSLITIIIGWLRGITIDMDNPIRPSSLVLCTRRWNSCLEMPSGMAASHFSVHESDIVRSLELSILMTIFGFLGAIWVDH